MNQLMQTNTASTSLRLAATNVVLDLLKDQTVDTKEFLGMVEEVFEYLYQDIKLEEAKEATVASLHTVQ